jgi:hypothetical protein
MTVKRVHQGKGTIYQSKLMDMHSKEFVTVKSLHAKAVK